MVKNFKAKYIEYILAMVSLVSIIFFGSGIAFGSSSNVAASVSISAVCYTSVTPTTISFGTLSTNTNVPTNVLVTDQDNGGNVASYLYISGNDWTAGSNSFGVSNTLWDPTTQATYVGTALSATSSNTAILIPAPTVSVTTTSNSIYFGLGVPSGVAPGTYTQTITIQNSC